MNEKCFLIKKLINILSSIRDNHLVEYTNKSSEIIHKCEFTNFDTEYQSTLISNLNSKNEEQNMTDITKIMNVVKTINKHCKEIDSLKASVFVKYQNEKQSIEQKSAEIIDDMQKKYDAYKTKHFYSIKSQVEKLVSLLTQDYPDELSRALSENNDYSNLSYEMCETRLYTLVEKINVYIQQLNAIDFDELVPPIKIF